MQYVIFNIPVFFILSVRDGFEVDLQWTATAEDSNILPAIFCGQPAFCNWYKHKHRDRPHTKNKHTLTYLICMRPYNFNWPHTAKYWVQQANTVLEEFSSVWAGNYGIRKFQSMRHWKLRTKQYPGNNPVKLICPAFAEQQAPSNASDMI